MIFIIIVALIIFAVFLISKYWNFKMIILKNFLKPKSFSDVLEILFICVFFVFFAGLLFLNFGLTFSSSHSCGGSFAEFRTGYKKALSVLNRAIMMSEQLDDSNPNNCKGCISNKQALANFFIPRFNVIDNFDTYTKDTLKELSKNKLLKNPYFINNDGMLYIIEKAQGRCGEINTTDPDKANCVIIIDVNGIRPPNEFSTGNKKDKDYKLNDRFRIIVLKNKVVPASNEENDVADYVFNR